LSKDLNSKLREVVDKIVTNGDLYKMKNQVTKRQHWNPRMHLKHFAIDGKIHIYDKMTMKINLTSIENAAVGKWFYDKDNNIENILSEIEGKVDGIFLKIIKTKQIDNLTIEERKNLNEFMVLQDYRTPKTRNQFETIYKEGLIILMNAVRDGEMDESLLPDGMPKDLWNDIPPPKENFIKFLQMIKEDPSYFMEFNKESAKRSTNMVLSGILPSGIDLFSKLKLRLFKNSSIANFFTSDHPVCRYNHYMLDFLGHITINGIGYNSEGIQLFYPLTPKLCLVFEDAVLYDMYEDVTVVNHEFVNFVNARLIQNSKRWIYSHTDNFKYVEDYLQEYPHFRNPNILFGLWRTSKNDLERATWERFYGKEAQRKLKNYLDHLIREGATEQEIEDIQTKYDLEYQVALENSE
jgi:hypothetical protein